MKQLSRKEMMKCLATLFGADTFMKLSEELSQGSPGGIWMTAEPGPSWKGIPAFDYYEELDWLSRDLRSEFPIQGEFKPTYEIGVHKEFSVYVNNRGWFCDWHDPGTMMLWELE